MVRFLGRYGKLPREIYILTIARFINSLGAFVHPLLALIMTDKLGFSTDEAGTFMTILLLSQLPAMLIGGKLADRFGRVKLVVIFQALGALTYLICGLMEMSNAIIYLIVIASNFYAMTYSAMDAMTMDLTHSGNRKEAFAFLYMGFNLGFAFGPMIGGLLFEKYLHWVFIGDAITTMISIVLVIMFVSETLPQKQQKQKSEVNVPQSKLEEHKEGSVWRILWQRKIILVMAGILFLIQFTYAQWAFVLPIQMKEIFPTGASDYGFLASFNGFLVILFTPIVTMIIRKWKVLYGTIIGALLFASAFSVLIVADRLIIFYASMFLLTLGEVVSTIDSRAFLANISPSSHRGRVNSVVNLISGAGRMISPLAIGYVIANIGITVGYITISSASVLAAILLFLSMQNRKMRKQINMVDKLEND